MRFARGAAVGELHSISSFGNTVARAAPINVVQLTWSVLSRSMLNLRMGKTLQTLSAVRK